MIKVAGALVLVVAAMATLRLLLAAVSMGKRIERTRLK
jgi:hypothetical protein